MNSLAKNSTACKICGNVSDLFDCVDFLKTSPKRYPFGLSGIPIYYYRCKNCSHIFCTYFDIFEHSDWEKYVYNNEYVKVDPDFLGKRAEIFSNIYSEIFKQLQYSRCLDYGSGKGLFAEFMKINHDIDNIDSYDPYTESDHRIKEKYDIVTAFEVFEHWNNPVVELGRMHSFLKAGGIIFFSTELQPQNIEEIGCTGWNYAAPRNGHINLYSVKSLERLADMFHMKFIECDNIKIMISKMSQFQNIVTYITKKLYSKLFLFSADIFNAIERIEFSGGWHNAEYAKQEQLWFKWTSENQASLKIYFCNTNVEHVTIKAIVYMQVYEHYLNNCFWFINDCEVLPLHDKERTQEHNNAKYTTLTFENVRLLSNSINIDIQLPDPISPALIRQSSDKRKLGLALGFILLQGS